MIEVVRDDDSAEFFDGTARGDLMIKRCRTCGHSVRPDAISCSKCRGTDLAWVEASGRGSLVSWIVVPANPPTSPSAAGPAVVGLVELEEGPWLHARLVDVDTAALQVGDALAVDFEPAGPERVPVFRPA